VDEINLLDDEVVDILIKVLSDGYVTVEREGLSVKYPCRPLMIATYNPQEGEIREHLLDRFAVALSADAYQLSPKERVMGVDNVIGFSGGTQVQMTDEANEKLQLAEAEEQSLRTKVEMARILLQNVTITPSQVQYICEEATRGGCEGQRAEIFATKIAKASAALDGRTVVSAGDLKKAVILAILPRATIMPGESENGDVTPETSKSLPPQSSDLQPIMALPPPTQTSDEDRDAEGIEETEQEEDKIEPESEKDAEDKIEQDDRDLPIPAEFIFGVKEVNLSPTLLKFSRWTRRGRGGKRAKIFSLLRGRFVKAIFPRGNKASRLAVGATLRAAAPHQKSRRQRAIGTKLGGRVVIVRKEDFRIKRMSRKSGTLVIFLVDASGSMALNRMNAAKGAAISLLSEAYKSRDKISLITFHGERAEVMVPPTKSIVLTKNRLEAMPCGGGSPLAHGLTLAIRIGLNTMKVKQDVGR
jgi:magnesium chelatase subunit D